jgi:hypothetical protein
MRKSVRKWITWYLVLAMFVIGITPRVYAGFSPSEAVGILPYDRSSDLQSIQKVLELKMIRERLQELGFTMDEIQARLSQLDDQQIHQFALQLDDLKVGSESFLGILVAILVIAILVVVLLHLTGHKIIVKD